MTIILGFTCKNGVVLASDSQMSYTGGGATSKAATSKVVSIGLMNGRSAVLAKAGSCESAEQFNELFASKAASCDLVSPRSLADLAEECMRELRAKLFLADDIKSLSDSDERARIVAGFHFEMLLGYLHADSPRLYALNFSSCMATLSQQTFAALGCGSTLAASVLSGFDLQNMSVENALAVAFYAVEFCKANDWACGGLTQFRMLCAPSLAPQVTLSAEDVPRLEQVARTVRDKMHVTVSHALFEELKAQGLVG